MVRERKRWTFPILLYEYLELDCFFERDTPFKELEWFNQVEMKKVASVYNAFTGLHCDVESGNGMEAIRYAFETGFGRADIVCSNEQIIRICELLNHSDIREQIIMEGPTIGILYSQSLEAIKAEYNYYTAYNWFKTLYSYDERSRGFEIVDEYMYQRICKPVAKLSNNFYKAIEILLGKEFERTFTIEELIDKYDYPTVNHEELNNARIDYCRKRYRKD